MSERSQHDAYFKNGLSIPRIQVAFLEQHLPAEILKDMDLSQIRNESENLIGDQLNTKVVDVLLSVPYKEGRALIYILVEHQSSVDPMMPLRLLIYVLQILERWLRQNSEDEKAGKSSLKLPIIFPMVYYNGETEYKGPRVLADLFVEPETFTKIFNGPMKVIDLSGMDTEYLKNDTWAYVYHMFMKHVYNPEIRQIILDLMPYMMQIEKESCGVEFVVRSFKYLVSSARGFKENDLAEATQLLTSSRGEIMTIMEQWLEYKARADSAEARLAQSERERAEAERERAEAERREAEAERRAREEIARARAEAQRALEAERLAHQEKENGIRRLLATGMTTQTVSACLNVPIAQVERLLGQNSSTES